MPPSPKAATNKYTAAPWRDIGHARWHDPLAALEDPDSDEFKAAVAREDAVWSEAVKHAPHVAAWRAAMERYQKAAWPETRRYAQVNFKWCGHDISIQQAGAGYTYNVWINSVWHREALSGVGFGPSGWFYTLEDVGAGAEDLTLHVWQLRGSKVAKQWSRPAVGPSVVIRGKSIYFSTVENRLRYPDVWRADLQTGHRPRRLFYEPDLRVQVSFSLVGDAEIIIHTANALHQRLAHLDLHDTVQWITPAAGEHSTLVPITAGIYARDVDIVFVAGGARVPLPRGHHIEDASRGPGGGLLITTVHEGRGHLWFLRDTWELLWNITEEISEVLIQHEPTEWPTFVMRRPSEPDTVWELRDEARTGVWKLVKCQTFPEPLHVRVVTTGTATEDRIPYTVVSHVAHPRKLLVEAYGAYGISSRRAYPVRWLAWLKRGYAVAYVCPRGGREGGDPWYDAARTAARKHVTFQDTAAAVKAIQRRLSIAPKSTVFFGRSAGGWLAANIAQDHGDLVGAVYAEVPYVDVLRTTTNPTLPLTALEYDEFGDPTRRPAEWRALKKISPVDTVPPCDHVCPALVIRTAIHDSQVLPYEALKWSTRLRAAGWPAVYVGIDHDGGHFAAAKSMIQQRAEDAAILDAAITESH